MELNKLRLAAVTGDLQLVKWLLQDLGADINVECAQLYTPLSVALQHAPDAIVDFMMSQNFEPERGQLVHHAMWRALR
jgi:hypothetical protein